MEEQIRFRAELLGIECITLEESLLYQQSPLVNHTIWNMREYGEDVPYTCFADNIESSIRATVQSYQVPFEPFAIYQEPIRHQPGGDAYWFCRVHLYTKK